MHKQNINDLKNTMKAAGVQLGKHPSLPFIECFIMALPIIVSSSPIHSNIKYAQPPALHFMAITRLPPKICIV